jgi:hypothetical protein
MEDDFIAYTEGWRESGFEIYCAWSKVAVAFATARFVRAKETAQSLRERRWSLERELNSDNTANRSQDTNQKPEVG